VFHADIASSARAFVIVDVVERLTAKLIRRHPHVFTPNGRPLRSGGRTRGIHSAGQVVEQWQALKSDEQQAAGLDPGVLAGVPRALPALLRAHKIGGRVAAVGFDWPNAASVVDKIDEEVRELRDALHESPARVSEEFGDLLFSIANLARQLGVEPESALREANDKFTRRFTAVEATLGAQGRSVHGTSLDELEATWQAVKGGATRASSTSARSSNAAGARRRRSRA
jgi:ATP diphosphatase